MTGPVDKGRPVDKQGSTAEKSQTGLKVYLATSDESEPKKTGKTKKRRRSRGNSSGRSAQRSPRGILGRGDSGRGGSGGRAGGGDRKTPRKTVHPVYAALDLGTNNCRLLVARPSRRGFVVVDAFSRIIRLGEGVSTTGSLSEEAMHRTIDALKVCSNKMQRQSVRRSRLIATQACRIAGNADDFIDRVLDKTGLELEIIDQETEARLAVSGCASLLEPNSTGALVFDIGGGSSELIWLDLRGEQNVSRNSLKDRLAAQSNISCWTSLPVGVVTISQKFGGHDVTPQIFEEMVLYVMDLLSGFEQTNQIAEQLASGKAYLLGTSGTVTTLAGIYLGLPFYDRRKVDGCWLKAIDVRDVSRVLVNMSYEKRAAQPCIGAERADLVLGGCAILEAIMRMWPCERLRVADRGLREGILATLMAEDNVMTPRQRQRTNQNRRGR